MAAAGTPTLLVDADLRRPSIAATFDLDPAVGLTQVLVGDLSVADVLQDTGTPNLKVMTAGRIQEVFGIACEVVADPQTGTPMVIPLARSARRSEQASDALSITSTRA
jgi:hypothetical protein